MCRSCRRSPEDVNGSSGDVVLREQVAACLVVHLMFELEILGDGARPGHGRARIDAGKPSGDIGKFSEPALAQYEVRPVDPAPGGDVHDGVILAHEILAPLQVRIQYLVM